MTLGENLRNSTVCHIDVSDDSGQEIVHISTSCGAVIRLSSTDSSWKRVFEKKNTPIRAFSVRNRGVEIPECKFDL